MINSSVKKIIISAALSFLLFLTGTVCYVYSIGINPWIDKSAIIGLLSGMVLTVFTLIWSGFSFIYFLIKRKFSDAFICFSVCPLLLLSVAIIMPATGKPSQSWLREECAERMQKMDLALKMYAKDHNDMLPADDWCDILVMDYKQDPSYLFCRGHLGRFREGETSYALNAHIMTTRLSELPSDIVIAFETDYAGENPGELVPVGQRKYTQVFGGADDIEQVRKGAWNQVGDISIISYEHHAGFGCNILFADGHVEFVKKKGISKLRWKP